MKKGLVTTLMILVTLYGVNTVEADYNRLVWKQTVKKLWARSIGRDRPEPPHTTRAYTKAEAEVDFDYYTENWWNEQNGINDIVHKAYGYLRASGFKGTWSLKVYAPNSSDNFDQSGKWWSGVYKEKRAKYTEEHREKDDDGNIVKDFEESDVDEDDWVYYAIDYFQSEANAQVTGTPWSGSGGDGDFRSQAEAKKFSNTAGIKWKCDRSGTSDYHNGQKCRMCN